MYSNNSRINGKKLYKIGAGKIMTNETEISLEEIKTILSNYKGLKKQIRKHISDLYDDLMDTDNLIETVSIKKTEISETVSYTHLDVYKRQL